MQILNDEHSYIFQNVKGIFFKKECYTRVVQKVYIFPTRRDKGIRTLCFGVKACCVQES